jgi:ADP-ribose pyrophosphatase YjhB (NUDIX family)
VRVLQGIHRRSLRLLRRVPTPWLERAVRLGSPSYTLGAACMIEHDGKVLLVQTAYRRTWSLPGGLLGRGEPPLDGLRREVREEVSLEVDVVGDPIVIVDLGSQIVDFFYRASLPAGTSPSDARPGATEIEAVGWFDRDEARTRVRGGSRLRQKFALFDDLPDGGGLVVLERGRRVRRGAPPPPG